MVDKVSKAEQYFLDKIRQGDQQAWSDFVGRYRGRLLRFARAKLPQRRPRSLPRVSESAC